MANTALEVAKLRIEVDALMEANPPLADLKKPSIETRKKQKVILYEEEN